MKPPQDMHIPDSQREREKHAAVAIGLLAGACSAIFIRAQHAQKEAPAAGAGIAVGLATSFAYFMLRTRKRYPEHDLGAMTYVQSADTARTLYAQTVDASTQTDDATLQVRPRRGRPGIRS